jgi:hypothetical protein
MKTIKLYVDTKKGRREVEFIGRKVSSKNTARNDDCTMGATETEYLSKNGRHFIHVEQWRVDQPDDPVCYILKDLEGTNSPLSPEISGVDRKQTLTLDEGLALSIPAKWVDD